MDEQAQQLTINVWPKRKGKPQKWSIQAYVYGDWAVHVAHPRDPLGVMLLGWRITHVPTGSCAYATRNREVAIEVAQKLAQLPSLTVNLIPAIHAMPSVETPPLEWVLAASEALAGMDIWAVSGGRLIRPGQLHADMIKPKHSD